MIKIESWNVSGFIPAMRGMRNPMNSWDRGDTTDEYIGPNDLELARNLAIAGPVHAKYRRMIVVWVDVTAPLYWWKEFDTYKVGTVANSCSTMHKLANEPFELDDFSYDHLMKPGEIYEWGDYIPEDWLKMQVMFLNQYRKKYLDTKDKKYWWQMIQLLPSSYNQKRTVMLNYEVLSHIYKDRKDHKLDEWRDFCKWIENLPYAGDIIMPLSYSKGIRKEKRYE